jgi:hypothetical protein
MSEEIDIPDPMTQMAENAVHLHEMYISYVDAGFTEDQAFDLIKTILIIITENAQAEVDDDDD